MKNRQQTAFYLTLLALLLTLAACAVALFAKGVYHDNAFVQTAWQANDWVTLSLMPALAIVLFFRLSIKAQLIWAGLLGYLAYNYTFYLFGAAFNVLFPLYLCIVSVSCFALVFLTLSLPLQELKVKGFVPKFIAGYLCIIGLMLLVVEVLPIVDYIISGSLPQMLADTGHPTAVVYALDLTYVVPVSLLAAIWLWQNKSAGILLAAMMLVKGISYGLVLCAGNLLLRSRGIAIDPLLPFYIVVAIGGTTGLILLFSKLPQSVQLDKQSEGKEPIVEC